ncbi:MFS transporter [Eubacterium maltosivorans]|uniref:MFS transporter n=1 Tax=Eubacterium maltosivorans TaxID=2041044 RepID=A0A4P9C3V3_EUBML|nr:MFS transporter [Eubacterium maltosivorans]QCT69950.1 MFS transporter [Eubacterium maltosivorans]
MNKNRTYSKWSILFTVLIMTFMVTLDGSIVNVALPVMSSELNASMGDIEWVASIYLVVTCATILIFGRLGDMIGKVRIFQIGVILFTIGSLLCSISGTLPLLIGARVVQGLGSAAALANNQGIITESFPPDERGKALGFVSTFVALGSMTGPTLGGMILTVLPWTYIFLINIPVGVLSFLIGLRTLPNKKPAKPGRLDAKGSVLLLLSILLLFGSFTLLQNGVSLPIIIGIIAGAVFLVLFIVVEKRMDDPLVPIGIFKNKMFSLNLFTMLTAFVAIGANNIIMPFYLQDARQFSPGMAGLLMTVIPLITAVMGPISGTMSDHIGSELPTMIGLIFTTIGLALMTMLGIDTTIAVIILFLAVIAVGSALFQSPNNSLVMGSVSRDELGLVGSLAGLVRNMGMSVGITAGTSLLYSRMSDMAGYRVTNYIPGHPDIFLYGLRSVYIMLAVVVFVGALLTIIRFVYARRQERKQAAQQEK